MSSDDPIVVELIVSASYFLPYEESHLENGTHTWLKAEQKYDGKSIMIPFEPLSPIKAEPTFLSPGYSRYRKLLILFSPKPTGNQESWLTHGLRWRSDNTDGFREKSTHWNAFGVELGTYYPGRGVLRGTTLELERLGFPVIHRELSSSCSGRRNILDQRKQEQQSIRCSQEGKQHLSLTFRYQVGMMAMFLRLRD